MGKRQMMYRSSEIADSDELVGKEVNLLTVARRVWHGRIVAVNQSHVELKDARKGKHSFSIDQIDKIYRDIVTEY